MGAKSLTPKFVWPGARRTESGGKGRQIRRPFYSDIQISRRFCTPFFSRPVASRHPVQAYELVQFTVQPRIISTASRCGN